MSTELGKIIVVSGPSGVGKNKVIERFINKPELNLASCISATSRAKREDERDGINYDFMTKEQFEAKIQAGDFVEYVEFLGDYYGTLKDSVEHIRKLGKNVLLEVEASGASKIKEMYPDCLTLFIVPTSLDSLETMIRERRPNEAEEKTQERLKKAQSELHLIGKYKFVVNADDTQLAADIASVIIQKFI